MKRTLPPLLLLFVGLSFLVPQPSTAQNENDTPAAQQKTDPRGPLPYYYGKLGLDEEQREKLYAIQDEYKTRIEAVEKQIAQIRGEQDAKMQLLLTAGQKLRLQELREAAAKKKAEEESEAARTASSAPAENDTQ